jgi:hypothetical protein
MRVKGNACRVWVGNPDRKRLLGGSRRTWEDNIKMGCKEIEWECVTRFIWLRIGISGGLL